MHCECLQFMLHLLHQAQIFYLSSRVQHDANDLPTAKTWTVTKFWQVMDTYKQQRQDKWSDISLSSPMCLSWDHRTNPMYGSDDDIQHFPLSAYCSVLASTGPCQLAHSGCPLHRLSHSYHRKDSCKQNAQTDESEYRRECWQGNFISHKEIERTVNPWDLFLRTE